MSIKRQGIVDAIEARLKTINVAGGYHTELGQNVFVWRRAPLAEAELPAAIVYDRETSLRDVAQKGATPLAIYEMEVEIHVVAGGDAVPSAIRQLAADVYKAIGTDDTFGGLALFTTPSGDTMYLEHQGEVVADAAIRFAVRYRTDLYKET